MVYLDNAATTPILPEVVELMKQTMLEVYGNPSSIHQAGKKAKSLVESSRKQIAKHFNISSKEVIFTSGGTEANNFILYNSVVNLGVKHIVTSSIEHHAVLDVVSWLKNTHDIELSFVNLNNHGEVDLNHLDKILTKSAKTTLVSLMMINNEIGNLLDVDKVCKICKSHQALFHSDTVQAIGNYWLDLQKTPIDFITASAHKFHGPKGVGFVCVKKEHNLKPILHGGGQERGLRSGTENVHSIVGMTESLRIAYLKNSFTKSRLSDLKEYFINELINSIPGIEFNGLSSDFEKSTPSILNVRFPFTDKLLLLKLDMKGFCVSSGSACQSGVAEGSHVLKNILSESEYVKTSLRFSFSRFSSKENLKDVKEFLISQHIKA